MNKGIVLKVKKQYAIVLREDHLYCKVKIKGQMAVGQKLWFLEEDVLQTRSQKRDYRRSIAAIATVAALFAVMMITPLMTSETSYSIVSVDINPSLEMKVDEDDLVVEIIPLNDEAEDVIQDIALDRPVTDVLHEILLAAEALDYLNNNNNYVLISTADVEEDGSLSDALETYVTNNMTLTSNVKIFLIESDQETLEEAHNNGISLGRMALSKKIKKNADQIDSVKDAIEDDEDEFSENLLIAETDEGDKELLESEEDDLLDSVNRILGYLFDVSNTEGVTPSVLDQFNTESEYALIQDVFLTEEDMTQGELVELHKDLIKFWNDIKQDYRPVWVEDEMDEDKAELIDSLVQVLENLKLVQPDLKEEHVNLVGDYFEKLADYDNNGDGGQPWTFLMDIHKDTLLDLKKEGQDIWQEIRMDYKELWQDDEEASDDDSDDYSDLFDSAKEMYATLQGVRLHPDYASIEGLDDFLSAYDFIIEDGLIWSDTDKADLKALKSDGQTILVDIRKNHKNLLEKEEDDGLEESEKDKNSGKPEDKPGGKPDKDSKDEE